MDKNTSDLLHSQFTLLYKDTFQNYQALANHYSELTLKSPTSGLNMLQHFEKSYF